jgi:5-methylcytosine-specific restriction protein B
LRHISARFQNYGQCPWRNRYHVPEIAEAVFNLDKRTELLSNGLSKEVEIKIEEGKLEDEQIINKIISLPQLAEDTGFDEAELARWVRAIERKGQAILYGPPGTGKTFVAEKLAQHLIGGGDGFFDLVQFHPAYAYEDFVQGIRPQSQGDHLSYPVVPGRFLDFCAEASQRAGRCVLIIDEINRANLSRVFGELMYLLEYRERAIPLAAGGQPFQIPANVRLIGTMNTADRSIALVDHALRRRFAFLALYPNYDLLRRYHQRRQTGFPVEGLIAVLQRLNGQINDPHYAVGVTFFLTSHLADELEDIWRMEIEPYLEEYFFDQPGKVADFRWEAVQSKVAP